VREFEGAGVDVLEWPYEEATKTGAVQAIERFVG
jgi:hypothetical protein